MDHPRSRGVDVQDSARSSRASGSSPLARGRRQADLGDPDLLRIIPARAGSTTKCRGARRPAGDHPRSRGVDMISARVMMMTSGSSPLARGRRRQESRGAECHRIIPARAGSTSLPGEVALRDKDHPRSRGVDFGLASVLLGGMGSSPLARGRRLLSSASSCARGIIPARAGSTRGVAG